MRTTAMTAILANRSRISNKNLRCCSVDFNALKIIAVRKRRGTNPPIQKETEVKWMVSAATGRERFPESTAWLVRLSVVNIPTERKRDKHEPVLEKRREGIKRRIRTDRPIQTLP